MTSKPIASGLIFFTIVVLVSCSKTEDTAPERRIFGTPPTIQSVSTEINDSHAAYNCDFSAAAVSLICENTAAQDVQPQTGYGCTVVVDAQQNVSCVFSDVPTTTPGIFIKGTYTEI